MRCATLRSCGLFSASNDRIVIQGFAGDDIIEASGVGAGVVGLTLSGRGLSFDWLMAHASDVNGDTILGLGDQQITLRGVSSSSCMGTTSS
jgi:hypothetical protein